MLFRSPASLSLCPPEPLFLSVPPSCSLFCLFLTLSSIPGHNNGGEHRPDPASPPNTPALALWGAFPSSQPLNPAPANPPIHAHTPHKYIHTYVHTYAHIHTRIPPHTGIHVHTHWSHTNTPPRHTHPRSIPQSHPARSLVCQGECLTLGRLHGVHRCTHANLVYL